jgi:hypothetical protein
LFPVGQRIIKNPLQTVSAICIFCRIQVEVQDGMLGPFRLQLFDGKTFEQFLLAAEVSFHGRDEQRLAESARTTQKVITSRVGELIDECRLVDVDISVITDLFKVLYSDWIFHIAAAFPIHLQI